jgi:hypothetical protein
VILRKTRAEQSSVGAANRPDVAAGEVREVSALDAAPPSEMRPSSKACGFGKFCAIIAAGAT